jgi:hypothetical protein
MCVSRFLARVIVVVVVCLREGGRKGRKHTGDVTFWSAAAASKLRKKNPEIGGVGLGWGGGGITTLVDGWMDGRTLSL